MRFLLHYNIVPTPLQLPVWSQNIINFKIPNASAIQYFFLTGPPTRLQYYYTSELLRHGVCWTALLILLSYVTISSGLKPILMCSTHVKSGWLLFSGSYPLWDAICQQVRQMRTINSLIWIPFQAKVIWCKTAVLITLVFQTSEVVLLIHSEHVYSTLGCKGYFLSIQEALWSRLNPSLMWDRSTGKLSLHLTL